MLYFEKAHPLMKEGLKEIWRKGPNDIVVLNTENIFSVEQKLIF